LAASDRATPFNLDPQQTRTRKGITNEGRQPGSGTQTTTSTTELPAFITNAANNNLNAAYGVSQNLLGPWTGPTVATMTPGANADIAAAQSGVGSAQPAYNLAQGTAAQTQGFNPLSVTPGSLATTDLSKYMNPYTSAVINPTLQQMEQQRAQNITANGAQAASDKAFGGSREAVQEGVTNAQSNLAEDSLIAQLESQNFGQAQQAAQSDIATNLAGQQANQNADLSGAGLRLQGAVQGGNLANQGSATFLQQLQAALSGQGMLQQQNQNEINSNINLYNQQQQYPLQQLQIASQTLAGTPYGSTTTQQTQLPPGNGLMQGIGAGASILGGLGSMFGTQGAFPLFGKGQSIFS
jgi:hypothetical protein